MPFYSMFFVDLTVQKLPLASLQSEDAGFTTTKFQVTATKTWPPLSLYLGKELKRLVCVLESDWFLPSGNVLLRSIISLQVLAELLIAPPRGVSRFLSILRTSKTPIVSSTN